ncbi:hypothetical protein K7X08_025930 [Anisodus acutangulus]|uniref:F-box domain-containing protein n=1 Tax=Anisodus acutangulus TaxID=402998 RepID=A0A9Q1N248_9SOLA|nr:hypothetical protein K7X08_025930 [Anisodus acutangulus]
MKRGTTMSSSAVSVHEKKINSEVCERTIRSEGESLNKLDDDALIQILCCLPLKDAARTSVLSRRWRANAVKIVEKDVKRSKRRQKKASKVTCRRST